jgi:hypothetical protein
MLSAKTKLISFNLNYKQMILLTWIYKLKEKFLW